MVDPIMHFDHTNEILQAIKSKETVYIKDQCTDLAFGFNNNEYFNLETFRRFWSKDGRMVIVDLIVRDGHAPVPPLCRTNAWISASIIIGKPSGAGMHSFEAMDKRGLEDGFPLSNFRAKYATYDNFRMTFNEAEKFLDGLNYETLTRYELLGKLKDKQDTYQEKVAFLAASRLPSFPGWEEFPTDEEFQKIRARNRDQLKMDIDPDKCDIYMLDDRHSVKIHSGKNADTSRWHTSWMKETE